ncbi:hypothetical protein FQN50_006212 [Emmonsiellopsis sp. PD_5]|nr:hypothetical protein FQN50_006212 [Emmonsiellopsis sp. PD_5]
MPQLPNLSSLLLSTTVTLLLSTSTPTHAKPLVSAPGDLASIPGWHLQSTKHVSQNASALSIAGAADVSSWYRTSSRATLMAGLIENGVYADDELFFSSNLNDTTNADKANFDVPWLYREEFEVGGDSEGEGDGQYYFLQTHGITSRADIYVNGALVAGKETQVGSYGGQRYEITEYVKSEGANCVLVQSYPTNYTRDLAIGFLDWNPYPPDTGSGVWRNIDISKTGPVAIVSRPRVVTDFEGPKAKSVKVTVKVDVRNNGDEDVEAEVSGGIEQAEDGSRVKDFSKVITLGPKEEKTVLIETTISKPRIWWPATWGEQPLYTANALLKVKGEVSDIGAPTTFGIRRVTSVINSHEDVEFSVNGKPFLVMGAGYTPDMFLRFDAEKTQQHLQLVLDMGLNTIRLEGKQEQPELYDMADRMGLMILAGWECCNKWEGWTYNDEGSGEIWGEEDYRTGEISLLHEAAMMQAHPSMLGFLLGSDFWPDDRATKMYVDGFSRMDWNNPIVSSAAKRGEPDLIGTSGMKMDGPYDWVPPNYWYDSQLGAAYGFGSELGSGVGAPELASLKKFLTNQEIEELWTKPDQDSYHLSRNPGRFDNRVIYNGALFARYGKPTSLEDFLIKVQITDYEATRSQFEAYAAKKNADRPSTGLIYWMLNSAWPNMHWSLFDYYLKPIGAYFGTKVATRIEHVAYDYKEKAVYLINHSMRNSGKRTISVDIIDINGNSLATETQSTDTKPNSSKKVGAITTAIDKIQDVAFLKLQLKDGKDNILSRNVYWLPKTLDVLAWDNSTYYYTPVTDYADLSALNNLAPASVKVSSSLKKGSGSNAHVVLENESDIPAFFVRLNALEAAGGEEIAPIYWSDNYVTLFPGEKVEVSVEYEGMECGKGAVVEVSGFNVEKVVVEVC